MKRKDTGWKSQTRYFTRQIDGTTFYEKVVCSNAGGMYRLKLYFAGCMKTWRIACSHKYLDLETIQAIYQEMLRDLERVGYIPCAKPTGII